MLNSLLILIELTKIYKTKNLNKEKIKRVVQKKKSKNQKNHKENMATRKSKNEEYNQKRINIV